MQLFSLIKLKVLKNGTFLSQILFLKKIPKVYWSHIPSYAKNRVKLVPKQNFIGGEAFNAPPVQQLIAQELYRSRVNPTPINSVNNAISNTYRLIYKCHAFLEMSRQVLPIKPHLGIMKGGNFNPTPINRVNNAISNTYGLIYKCHAFLERPGQGLPIYPHIGLIKGVNLTPYPSRCSLTGPKRV